MPRLVISGRHKRLSALSYIPSCALPTAVLPARAYLLRQQLRGFLQANVRHL